MVPGQHSRWSERKATTRNNGPWLPPLRRLTLCLVLNRISRSRASGPLSQWLYSALAEVGLPVICVETRHMKAALRAANSRAPYARREHRVGQPPNHGSMICASRASPILPAKGARHSALHHRHLYCPLGFLSIVRWGSCHLADCLHLEVRSLSSSLFAFE
jgi:hypothetical protein